MVCAGVYLGQRSVWGYAMWRTLHFWWSQGMWYIYPRCFVKTLGKQTKMWYYERGNDKYERNDVGEAAEICEKAAKILGVEIDV